MLSQLLAKVLTDIAARALAGLMGLEKGALSGFHFPVDNMDQFVTMSPDGLHYSVSGIANSSVSLNNYGRRKIQSNRRFKFARTGL